MYNIHLKIIHSAKPILVWFYSSEVIDMCTVYTVQIPHLKMEAQRSNHRFLPLFGISAEALNTVNYFHERTFMGHIPKLSAGMMLIVKVSRGEKPIFLKGHFVALHHF